LVSSITRVINIVTPYRYQCFGRTVCSNLLPWR